MVPVHAEVILGTMGEERNGPGSGSGRFVFRVWFFVTAARKACDPFADQLSRSTIMAMP